MQFNIWYTIITWHLFLNRNKVYYFTNMLKCFSDYIII